MRETGEREGRVESFPPKSFINGEDTFTLLVWGFYIAPAKKNYKKNQIQKLLQGIKWEENQKGEQNLTSQTGSMKEQLKGREWQQEAILQPAKNRNL